MTLTRKRDDKLKALRRHAREVGRGLAKLYPDARCALEHHDAFQLLVATILSAQCTDKMVNKVTPALFARYPGAAALANARIETLEGLIRPTGFFRTKAKHLIACAKSLVEQHGGQVPADLAALTKLPGVGRKTANVVLGDAFGIPSMVVDTHVKRLSRRLGLTTQDDPVKIEQDLMRLFDPKDWTALGHRLISHGRQVCVARNPKCESCALLPICPRVGVARKVRLPKQ